MVADAPSMAVSDAAPEASPARWSRRAAAFAIDFLPVTGVLVTAALVGWTVPLESPWWYVAVSTAAAALLLTLTNRLLVPAATGFSLGRALMGVRVVTHDGSRVGPVRLLLRDVAHLADTATFLVGWCWPLWDRRRRTFADLLLRTEVWEGRPDRSVPTLRRRTATVVLLAALSCVALAGMSNLAVYRPDRIDEKVRAELAVQAPKTVAEMLSLNPKTLAEDFARARTLVSDKYRSELITAQELSAKTRTAQEYWVPDSAVLSASADRATMLMLLQGQTGTSPKPQPISVTIRVVMVRSGERWLVDELAFVPPPKPHEAGR